MQRLSGLGQEAGFHVVLCPPRPWLVWDHVLCGLPPAAGNQTRSELGWDPTWPQVNCPGLPCSEPWTQRS